MSRDHNSPIPFVDSTYGHGFPVQFPPQGRPFQTGHASERSNCGVAQFANAAIERSAATFPSAAPFQPFHPAVFQRTPREAEGVENMFSSSSETCRPEAGSSTQNEENGAKPASQTKWSNQQTSVLVEEWKERLDDVESSKSLEAWQKIVQAVNKAGPPKTMKRCKDKLRNLKQAYKDAKSNNSKTGRGAKTSPFFDVFEEVLGSRPVVKMPGVIQSSSEPSTSSHADSSESDGDEESSPEGKNKRKKANAPANAPPKTKARRSKESNQNAFIELSEKIIDMQNAQAEAMARSQTRAEELMLKLEMEQRKLDVDSRRRDQEFFLRMAELLKK